MIHYDFEEHLFVHILFIILHLIMHSTVIKMSVFYITSYQNLI